MVDLQSLNIHGIINHTPVSKNTLFSKINDDTNFSLSLMSGFVRLIITCSKLQNHTPYSEEGEFIRYQSYLIVNPKIYDSVKRSISNQTIVTEFFDKLLPELKIIEDENVSDDIIYLVENNNCITVLLED